MNEARLLDAATKLQIALEMFGLGESIMRQKLRRTFPSASEAEIEVKLSAWLSERPGAEHGDDLVALLKVAGRMDIQKKRAKDSGACKNEVSGEESSWNTNSTPSCDSLDSSNNLPIVANSGVYCGGTM